MGASVGAFAVTRNQSRLFVGLNEGPGVIRAYSYSPLSSDYFALNAHEKGITRMRLTHDDSYLYSVGQDGVLCVFGISSHDSAGFRR